jgi:hypothetical protein
MNSRMRRSRRVTSVGEMNCANFANRARAVEDARALAFGDLEEIRAVDVLHVERRVLAHQHRIERGERHFGVRVLAIPPVVLLSGEVDTRRVRGDDAFQPREIFGIEGVELVAALRGLPHHRVSAVLVELEVVERVDDEGDFHS